MDNRNFQIAEQFALQTNRSFFLTGKAGTGKTTLLKSIASRSSRNIVVVAPTGVAAINAGGVTIHSMFGLPLKSFIPSNDWTDLNLANNRKQLQQHHMNFRRDKLKVLRELELLVIDEVSMVRADIMDAVDFTLRTVRRNSRPFGGAQVMLIGDMHQLPPVVKDEEWDILKRYYNSPYFFDSVAWRELDALHIELGKVYRQSDERFLNLLNHIRFQNMEEDDFIELEKRYQPEFPAGKAGYILLTTHNRKADTVNENEMRKLPGKIHFFEAQITGDFPENLYPCDRLLQLKEGAQVMFIRNDAEGGKYFNGRLAVVKKISDGRIEITFSGTNEDYVLKRETWENVSYSVENGSDKINKKELGTFSQYPLRLAWAITIHKSQGLTFDKAIIDAGQSFAPGQVYVALSRCRTLEGMVLHSRITPKALYGDDRITAFSETKNRDRELEQLLPVAKAEYARHLLYKVFDFSKLIGPLSDWYETVLEKDIPNKEQALQLHEHMLAALDEIQTTSRKFESQLDRMITVFEKDFRNSQDLKERCHKAIEYFAEQIFSRMITPLHDHIVEMAFKARLKQYVRAAMEAEDALWTKLDRLYSAVLMDDLIYTGKKFQKSDLKQIASSATSHKKEKGGTYKDTLALYQQGKSVDEIAATRGLHPSTIKGHFAKWIESGKIDIYKVLSTEKIEQIEKAIGEEGTLSLGAMKAKLGDKADYAEINMVIGHHFWKKKQGNNLHSSV